MGNYCLFKRNLEVLIIIKGFFELHSRVNEIKRWLLGLKTVFFWQIEKV